MSQFKRDMEEKMRDPEYAYEFGRTERELEIIQLLEHLISRMSALNKNTGYGAHSAYMSIRIKALTLAIEQIKGVNE